jgi:predicted PurR-regulated permease PerM
VDADVDTAFMSPVVNRRFRYLWFAALLVGISAVFFLVVRRFILPTLLAAITAGIFWRPRTVLLTRTKIPAALGSLLLTVIVLLIFTLPLSGLVYLALANAIDLAQSIAGNEESIRGFIDQVIDAARTLPFLDGVELRRLLGVETLVGSLENLGTQLIRNTQQLVGNAASVGLLVFIYLYCLFFFFKDGEDMLLGLFDFIPFAKEEKDAVANKFISVTRAILKSTFIIGLIQGAVGGTFFLITGLEGAVLWGLVIMFFATIPNFGAILVWLPAALFLFFTGQIVDGVLMAAGAGGLITLVDYLLRPRLVKTDIQIHEILVLFGILGGLAAFGIFGLILGPIVAAIFVQTWRTMKDLLAARSAAETD